MEIRNRGTFAPLPCGLSLRYTKGVHEYRVPGIDKNLHGIGWVLGRFQVGTR